MLLTASELASLLFHHRVGAGEIGVPSFREPKGFTESSHFKGRKAKFSRAAFGGAITLGILSNFFARTTSDAAETGFPLSNAVEKHIFGLLSLSSIH